MTTKHTGTVWRVDVMGAGPNSMQLTLILETAKNQFSTFGLWTTERDKFKYFVERSFFFMWDVTKVVVTTSPTNNLPQIDDIQPA